MGTTLKQLSVLFFCATSLPAAPLSLAGMDSSMSSQSFMIAMGACLFAVPTLVRRARKRA